MRSWYRIFSIVAFAIAAGLAWGATATAQTQVKLRASDGKQGDNFSTSVSVSGDYAIIGAVADDENGSSSGSAYIFYRSGGTWTEQAKLTASDAAFEDRFGYSVSIDGAYAIVGAYTNDAAADQSGSAYIFKRSGTTWAEQVMLIGSDTAAHDYFGYSVSIDGEYAVVGAYYDDDDGSGSGSAYIFKHDGTNWNQQAKLTASDAAATIHKARLIKLSRAVCFA